MADPKIIHDEESPWSTFSVYFNAADEFVEAAERLRDLMREYGCDLGKSQAWKWFPKVEAKLDVDRPIFEISARVNRR